MTERLVTDKQAVAAGFSRAADTYNAHASAQKLFADNLCGYIKNCAAGSALDSGKIKIADLGCGTGFLSCGLRAIFPEAQINGFDLAPAMVDKCNKEFADSNTLFRCLDMEEDELGDGYSLVASSYAMQWVNCRNVFERIAEALEAGGLLAFTIPVDGSFSELDSAYSCAGISPAPRLLYNKVADVLSWLKNCGFNILQQEEENYSVFYQQAAQALRSFRCCGASFTRHQGHKMLGLAQARRLLSSYDQERMKKEGRVAITYNTLYVVASLEG